MMASGPYSLRLVRRAFPRRYRHGPLSSRVNCANLPPCLREKLLPYCKTPIRENACPLAETVRSEIWRSGALYQKTAHAAYPGVLRHHGKMGVELDEAAVDGHRVRQGTVQGIQRALALCEQSASWQPSLDRFIEYSVRPSHGTLLRPRPTLSRF